MIAIRTKNLSPLFSDLLGIQKFLRSLPGVSLVVSPGDGKDWELSGAIPEETKVYSLIPHIKGSRETIESHQLALGVSEITPLFPVGLDFEESEVYQDEFGLYNVEEVEEIIEAEDKLGRTPDIIRLSVNPLDYKKEILDYCKERGIKILGCDSFGSDLFREYFKRVFPETFLQVFGEYNSDILEVPGEDPYFIRKVYSRLGEGKDTPESLLKYSKTIKRIPSLRIPSQKVYQMTSIKIPGTGKLSIPGDKGKFYLKPQPSEFELGDPIWEDTLIPEDIDTENKEFLGTLHRYHVLPELSELHSPKIWKPVFTKIYPDFWAIKMIPKKWYGWFWKEYLYWMISGKLWKMPLVRHENLINE